MLENHVGADLGVLFIHYTMFRCVNIYLSIYLYLHVHTFAYEVIKGLRKNYNIGIKWDDTQKTVT